MLNRELVAMPTGARPRRAVIEHAPTTSNIPLRVRSEVEPKLLGIERYQKFSTQELMDWARFRLGLARLGPIRGIRVTDRVMAIAVLESLPDCTEYVEASTEDSSCVEVGS